MQIHGKEYVEVKDRVQMAHAEESFSMLKEETFEMCGRSYVRVYIEVKGNTYIGTAECKFDAKPGTADGSSPFECGETSALGRALGFAGYGVVESIASADEVGRNQAQQNGRAENVDPAVRTILGEVNALGLEWDAWKKLVLGAAIADKFIKPQQIAKLQKAIEEYKASLEPAA